MAMESGRFSYLMEQESTSCPICGEDNYRVLEKTRERGGFTITAVLCNNCTNIYLNPRPTRMAYKQFYEHSDYMTYVKKSISSKEINKARWKKYEDPVYLKKRLDHGKRLYNIYLKDIITKDDFVYDLGCGDGAWLQGIKEHSGCRVGGCDPDQFNYDFIKKTFNFQIEVGLIEELYNAILKKYKDKITCAIVSGSLQHMMEPVQCLQLIHDILEEDGYLYICNKNVFNHQLFRRNIGLKDYISIDHPNYFHKTNYEFMMNRAGFDILHFEHHSNIRYHHMEIFAKKIKKNTASKKRKSPDQIISMLKKARIRGFFSKFLWRFSKYLIKEVTIDV